VKVSSLLNQPSIKILLHLHVKGQTRHSELEKVIRSRGTLAANLNDLIDEGLVARKVLPTKPIQSNYSLTDKGRSVAKTLMDLQKLTES
jgi:DNA-binding HxlR family transcriptional regulator